MTYLKLSSQYRQQFPKESVVYDGVFQVIETTKTGFRCCPLDDPNQLYVFERKNCIEVTDSIVFNERLRKQHPDLNIP